MWGFLRSRLLRRGPVRRGGVLALALLLCGAGCGDDDASGADAGAGDAATPGVDAGSEDGGPAPGLDAGSPPACDLEPLSVTFAEGFGEERGADPDALVAAAPGGPFGYAWRASHGTMGGRRGTVRVLVADAAGAVVDTVALDEVRGSNERHGQVSMAAAAGGFFVAWERVTTDADGVISGAEIHHAAVADDGTVARPAALLYPDAAVPVLTDDPPDDLWMLRSEIDFVGSVTGVRPTLQHLDGAGDPKADDVPASSFLRVEATEVQLETAESGLALVYRVPPSTAFVVPLDREAVPARPERMVYGVPYVDDVAATDEAIAIGWTETVRGTATVGVTLTGGDGRVRRSVELESFDATYEARIAVVRAWPGFVAVWRRGEGPDAVLRAAGIQPDGRVLVDPVDLAPVPDLDGDVLAVSDGVVLTVGYRVSPAGAPASLGMTRVCAPAR